MDKHNIVLYRGVTPNFPVLDIYDGYGEIWTRDFEAAKRYARLPNGYILEAILHPDAKQLILITEPNAEGFIDYVQEGIQILAQIVNAPRLYHDLLSGWTHLWEIWDEEWTEAIIKAGYDTIFTGGFDGPEEYIMNPTHLQFTHYHRILADDKTKAYPIEPDTIEPWGQLGHVVEMIIGSQQ